MARNRLVTGDPLPAVCGLHPLPFPLGKVAPEGQGWDRGGGDQTLLLILLSERRVSCVFHPTDSLTPSGGLQTRLDTGEVCRVGGIPILQIRRKLKLREVW